MIWKKTMQEICKNKCGGIVLKCRYIKHNNRFGCIYFRKKVKEIYLNNLEEKRKSLLEKREMFNMAGDDFFDSKGEDIGKKEFWKNEVDLR